MRDLCAWLAALANPRDETALYGVLASPLVGLSSDALAHVARAGRAANAWRDDRRAAATRSPSAWRRRPRAPARPSPQRFAGRARARAAARPRRAAAPRRRRDGLRPARAALPGGPRRLANVHKLLRLAAAFERDHGRDVRGLVDLAAAELEAEARETDAPVELGDVKAVRLMTIHAAKGLEFGVVCVADLGRRRPGDGDDDLLVDATARSGCGSSASTARARRRSPSSALRDAPAQRAAREEERILYVAMTRARERLILSGGVPLAPWPKDGPGGAAADVARPGAARRRPRRACRRAEEPVRDVAWATAAARCAASLNAPATVGRVLRAGVARAGRRRPSRRRSAPRAAPRRTRAAGAGARGRATLSYSALAAWQACGYRFYLTRLLGLPEEPAAAPRARRRARRAGGPRPARARLARPRAARGGRAPPPSASRRGRRAFERAADRRGGRRRRPAHRRVRARPRSRARIAKARAVQREHGFAVALGATLLTGIVDVLAHERGGAQLVVDYKTDGLAPGADLAAYVARALRRAAARLRAGGAARRRGQRVEVAYAFLERPQEPVVARPSRRPTPRALRRELLALAAGMLAGAYPVTDRAAPRPLPDVPGPAGAVLAPGGADAARATARWREGACRATRARPDRRRPYCVDLRAAVERAAPAAAGARGHGRGPRGWLAVDDGVRARRRTGTRCSRCTATAGGSRRRRTRRRSRRTCRSSRRRRRSRSTRRSR